MKRIVHTKKAAAMIPMLAIVPKPSGEGEAPAAEASAPATGDTADNGEPPAGESASEQTGESKDADPEPLPVPPANPIPEGVEPVLIKNLVLDADTQNRVSVDQDVIAHYVEITQDAIDKQKPIPFPPLKAVRSASGQLLLWDGFQRATAFQKCKVEEYDVEIYPVPEKWDAVEYARLLALGANATHGQTRTRRDIQRALKNALSHPEWSQWANTVIAEFVGCSEGMVRTHRTTVSVKPRLTTRAGKTVTLAPRGSGGKKAAKKAAKAAKAGKPAKGKAGAKKAAEPAQSKADQEMMGHVRKIADALIGPMGQDVSNQVRAGLSDGSLDLTRADITTWASTSKDRIVAIAPLVIDHKWKPKRAFDFIDKSLDEKSKLEDLAMLLTANAKKQVLTACGMELKFDGAGTITITLAKKAKK